MKIILIGGRDFNSIGGVENYTCNLAHELIKHGHAPVVYCEGTQKKTEFIGEIKVVTLKSFKNRFINKPLLGLQATLHALRHEKDAQIYHYNGSCSGMFSLLPIFWRKNSITVNHSLEWKNSKYSKFLKTIFYIYELFMSHIHPHIIVVSQEQKNYFEKYFHRKCKYIPTAVYLPEKSGGSDILERLNLQPNEYFLSVGRLVKVKNPETLIAAYLKLDKTSKKLVLAGSDTENKEFSDSLKKLAGDNEDIIFAGPVYGADKNYLYENCFCFCMPSRLEGFPIALLEAMSFRKSSIVADLPSCREVLDNQGCFINPEDTEKLSEAMCLLEESPEHYASLRDFYYARVRDNFTWKVVGKEYCSFIEQLAK